MDELLKGKAAWIVGGGVALVALLVFMRGGSAGPSNTIDGSLVASLNSNIAASSIGAQVDANTLAFNSHIADVNANLSAINAETNAGITAAAISGGNSIVQSLTAASAAHDQYMSTAIASSNQADVARLVGPIAVAGQVSIAQAQAAEHEAIANIDANAAKHIADVNAAASTVQSFFGGMNFGAGAGNIVGGLAGGSGSSGSGGSGGINASTVMQAAGIAAMFL